MIERNCLCTEHAARLGNTFPATTKRRNGDEEEDEEENEEEEEKIESRRWKRRKGAQRYGARAARVARPGGWSRLLGFARRFAYRFSCGTVSHAARDFP